MDELDAIFDAVGEELKADSSSMFEVVFDKNKDIHQGDALTYHTFPPEYEKASKLYLKALKSQPDNFQLVISALLTLNRSGKHARVIKMARQYMDKMPEYLLDYLYYYLISSYFKSGQSEKVYQLIPSGTWGEKNKQIKQKIAINHYHRHEYEEAIQTELEIISHHPEEADLYRNLSLYYSGAKNYEKALEAINRYFELCSSTSSGHVHLEKADIYVGLEQFEYAFKQYELYFLSQYFSSHLIDNKDSVKDLAILLIKLYENQDVYKNPNEFFDEYFSKLQMAYASPTTYTEKLKWDKKSISNYTTLLRECFESLQNQQ